MNVLDRLAVPENAYISRQHGFDGGHGTAGGKVLCRIEGSLQQDNDEQDDAEREVGRLRVGVAERFPVGTAGLETVSD